MKYLVAFTAFVVANKVVIYVGCYALVRDWEKIGGTKGLKLFITTGKFTPAEKAAPELPPKPVQS
jgi:hypothetical protein